MHVQACALLQLLAVSMSIECCIHRQNLFIGCWTDQVCLEWLLAGTDASAAELLECLD